MTTKPILFSGPMVRALLEGRKTQTRRVLKPQPDDAERGFVDCSLPYAIGDLLWVREHWKAGAAYDDLAPSEMGAEEAMKYLADGYIESWGWTYDHNWGRHRQAMHMPRWASRLTLRVTDVRVQRVQAGLVTDDECRAVGIF